MRARAVLAYAGNGTSRKLAGATDTGTVRVTYAGIGVAVLLHGRNQDVPRRNLQAVETNRSHRHGEGLDAGERKRDGMRGTRSERGTWAGGTMRKEQERKMVRASKGRTFALVKSGPTYVFNRPSMGSRKKKESARA